MRRRRLFAGLKLHVIGLRLHTLAGQESFVNLPYALDSKKIVEISYNAISRAPATTRLGA